MSDHTLGDAPIQPEYRQEMEHLAMILDQFFNDCKTGPARKTGFVLMVFPFGDIKGRCNFLSNGADRKDLVCLFKEMIARFEGQPEMGGTA